MLFLKKSSAQACASTNQRAYLSQHERRANIVRNVGRFMVMNLRSNSGDWYCPIGRTVDNSPVRIRKVKKAIMRGRKVFR